MQFVTLLTSLLFTASTGVSAVLPRQTNTTTTTTTASTTSDTFILHSRPLNDTSTSLGYLHAEYSYPPGYYATLHTARSDAITAYLSDTNNVTNSSLVFPESDGYYQGFVLYPLTQTYPRSLAQIFSGQLGTKGVFVDEGGLLGFASGGGPVGWYACPNQALEWGSATGLWYKWTNVTTPSNCVDVELVAEYV